MTIENIIRTIVAAICVALFAWMVTACKTVDCIPEVVYRDSIRTEFKHDSTYIYERDSIFIKQQADTVFVNKYITRYKDVLKVERDTVLVMQEVEKVREVEVPVEVPRKRSGWDKFCTKWFIGSALVLLVLLLWWLADYIPALKGIKTIIKTFIKL